VDNLTHTLISVMVGEAIYRSTPASPVLAESARRNVAIAVMVIGGNLPDADLIYTKWASTTLVLRDSGVFTCRCCPRVS
jgi:inner membrane protein